MVCLPSKRLKKRPQNHNVEQSGAPTAPPERSNRAGQVHEGAPLWLQHVPQQRGAAALDPDETRPTTMPPNLSSVPPTPTINDTFAEFQDCRMDLASGQLPTKEPPPGTTLIPLAVDEDDEWEILRRQRLVCGWGAELVDACRETMRTGESTMFWIAVPDDDDARLHTNGHRANDAGTGLEKDCARETRVRRGDKHYIPAGHVALDRTDRYGCLDLANPDGSVLQITRLFVLPAFAGLGLGVLAMAFCEHEARREPYGSTRCAATALTTMSRKFLYAEEGSVELKHRPPRNRRAGDIQSWYEKQGYVAQREGLRYEDVVDGKKIKWLAVFMRKELG